MSHYRRAIVPGGTYFFTVVTYQRQKILCDEPIRVALREAIEAVRSNKPFRIDAWVLLPDHLHCIWTLPPGDHDFSGRWSQTKHTVSRRIGGQYRRPELLGASKTKHRESTIWQRRFWEHHIRDDEDMRRRIDYVHFNPVKHGLVANVADWPHSTFHRFVAKGVYPMNWAEGDEAMSDIED